MASLKNIKLKILSYKKTGTVTHAMEAVSAVKMRKGQERALSGRAYAASALSMLERLSSTIDMGGHPLMSETGLDKSNMKTCIVIITSDKGLAGSLNSGVIRAVEHEIARTQLPKQDIVMVAIGRRGGDYFASRGYQVKVKMENLADSVSESEIRKVMDMIIGWHRANEIGSCIVGYTNFISTFEQEPAVRRIIPITPQVMKEIIAGIRPARGKYSPQPVAEKSTAPAAYKIEPDADTVLTELLPKLLNVALFHSVLESKASEHSARMVAMKSATDKAKEMAHNLTRTFNKVRQAAITREVSEITSGIEAMK